MLNYISETEHNVEIRWAEHNNICGKSEAASHLYGNRTHSFQWRVVMSADNINNKQ